MYMPLIFETTTSWWFQPIWKKRSKWIISPDTNENAKYLKPPPSNICTWHSFLKKNIPNPYPFTFALNLSLFSMAVQVSRSPRRPINPYHPLAASELLQPANEAGVKQLNHLVGILISPHWFHQNQRKSCICRIYHFQWWFKPWPF